MSYTVGLDFGTHQTKVCIEDASNPAQKLYEFVAFKNLKGESSVLFPSIVQINEDDTVSYGFVDDKKCKFLSNDSLEEPKLTLSPTPELQLPLAPNKVLLPPKPKLAPISWQEQLKGLVNPQKKKEDPAIVKWQNECSKLQDQYDLKLKQWKRECIIRREEHEKELKAWESENKQKQVEYKKRIADWDYRSHEKLNFKYFKLAVFYNSKWEKRISPEKITVWYLTYILLRLQKKLGQEFYTQLGIPSGIDKCKLNIQKQKAYSLLIAAYKLVDLYQTEELFLKENFKNLIDLTEIKEEYSEVDVHYYGLKVLPEAFAGLTSITHQKRLEEGMSLLVDIVGGTTDIAFFTIIEDQPNIHAVISFPKGLNFIFDIYISKNSTMSIFEVQKLFFEKLGDTSLFNAYITQYHHHLKGEVNIMIKGIIESFELHKHNHSLTKSDLFEGLKNRHLVFCGGGAIYESMRIPMSYFTDIKIIDKDLLNIPSVVNQNLDEKLYTILATSYGLSIPLENEICLTPLEEVFNHLQAAETNPWNFNLEHGLTDY